MTRTPLFLIIATLLVGLVAGPALAQTEGNSPSYPAGNPVGVPASLSAERIARNIPSAASMCYAPEANQLMVPMNPNHGLAFVALG